MPDGGDPWGRLFADRYGASAHEELLHLFARPCVTYAQIARRFGVTRERVRQWHLTIAPDSPRGHERRRLCQLVRLRRRLLDEPVYGTFVRAARVQFPDLRVRPVPAKTGFRKRVVRLGQWTVALRRAARRRRTGAVPSYSLIGSRNDADFIFFRLDEDAYIFLPSAMVPRGGTTFLDESASKYHPFKNTLAAYAIRVTQPGDSQSTSEWAASRTECELDHTLVHVPARGATGDIVKSA